jgi:hypothetical protein
VLHFLLWFRFFLQLFSCSAVMFINLFVTIFSERESGGKTRHEIQYVVGREMLSSHFMPQSAGIAYHTIQTFLLKTI